MLVKTATACINLQALNQNFSYIQKKAPNSKVLAVLKANAYGHGLSRIAKALSQADAFGVARIEEALQLRGEGVAKPILLLEGFFDERDLSVIEENDLQTVIHNDLQLEAICKAKLTKPIKVWLKIDTGMHRLGIEIEEFSQYFQRLSASDNVQDDVVLMSHLGCADDEKNDRTRQQIAKFEAVTKGLTLDKSLANSAGVCAWPESHFQWLRPGLALYGVSPMLSAPIAELAPVMTLKSSIIAIKQIKKGDCVGYGAAWQAPRDTRLAVVAIGYGDGYPRHAVEGTPVLINGKIVPLVGRVAMDMITVDLGPKAIDEVGDTATLWGDGLPVERIAECADTIPYELLCNVARRVKITLI